MGYIFYCNKEPMPAIYDEKYIMLEVGSEIHFVTMPEPYHSDIYALYANSLPSKPSTSCVRGGGIVTINSKEKTIKTYGRSGGFGKPNEEQVKACLEATKPEFQIEVTVTSYIRG
mmetsp:Transcript_36935/g.57265  ORF Transcript_36935/g.57265 Transcript_36935/m.57265 type:complete len:115 (-) Transcript_36935:35-379(-)